MTDEHHADRRSFLRTGAIAGTALVAGATAMAQQVAAADDSDRGLTKGDVAILRFLAAVEILETDLWQQYNELGGIQDSEVPGGTGNTPYTDALNNLDTDMSQYIHDNTEDEFTHQDFINAYLVSKGAKPVNLEGFRTLPGSQATGAIKTKNGSPISCSSPSTQVGGRGIAAAPITLISTRRSCSRKRSQACSQGRFRQSHEMMPT